MTLVLWIAGVWLTAALVVGALLARAAHILKRQPRRQEQPVTEPMCGLPHYQHTESCCTEPAGHYIRDRDPHAGPLIIDGRECGGIAWDEPEEEQ